jgi:chemotaxis protein CheD
MKHAKNKVILHAGEYCFGNADTHVHTLLGSCIAITVWHPDRRIGGMCHFALPSPSGRVPGPKLDPRYAEDCIQQFKRSAARHQTELLSYDVKIFGGGNMYKKRPWQNLDSVQNQPVGDKNVASAATLLMDEGIDILVAHVGEYGYRQIVFDISTGDVWVQFTPSDGDVGDVRSLRGPK